MKKFWKGAVCVLLILLCALGFAAKYDTRGIYPGMDVSQMTAAAAGHGLMGDPAFYFYRNTFGRTVIARVATDSQYDFRVYRNISKQYGSAVVGLQTASPGIATHWDFLNIDRKLTSLHELISQVGMPVETSRMAENWIGLVFVTLDGYRYTVRAESTGFLVVIRIQTPNGLVYQAQDGEVAEFQQKVEWFYTCLLCALIALLICLLTVPNAIRRRKTGKNPRLWDKRKLLKNGCCILLILVMLMAYDAKYQTHGAYPGQEYGFKQMFATQTVIGEEIHGGTVYVYPNGYGRTVLVRNLFALPKSWERNVYDAVGQIAVEVQTVPQGIATHLDFFNCRNSYQQFADLLRRAGMPEYHPNGPGWPEYTFTTVDGYKYIVRAQYDGTARLLNVWTPDGEHYYGETLDAFTVKVLVQYLALAVALSGILVVLLTVSNAIRKRNEKLKMDN